MLLTAALALPMDGREPIPDATVIAGRVVHGAAGARAGAAPGGPR